jgi:hypothetical protein
MVARTSGTAVVISNAIDVTDRAARVLGQTSTGSVTDVTDRAARLLGKPASFAVGTSTVNAAGNVSTLLGSAGQVWIIKTALITTAAGGSNRSLSSIGQPAGSKTVAPSSTAGDLLDREVSVVGNGSILITNGAAGDTYYLTAEQKS